MTFLFTDIEGSTRLALRLGTGYQAVLHQHRRLLRRIVCAGGGVELFTEGDSFFFAFADATAAVTACHRAQQALSRHDWPDPGATPMVRMGLHSGWAQPRGGEYASPEVHRAARIAAAAHGGQVLCSAATAGQTRTLPADTWLRDLGHYRLRGFEGRERLFQLVAPDLPGRFPQLRTAPAAPHNLPALPASFIGREREQAHLGDLLAGNRLVTVLGAGGVGKTRLAVQVAAARVGSYADGVWFVDLAAVTDPAQVAVTVAAGLGVRPEPGRPAADTLADHVTDQHLLLVADTCDAQVQAVAPLVARLLARGAAVSVLATSRRPLGLPDEARWRIPPLSPARAADGGPGDAVRLLADRTAAARGGRPVPAGELLDLSRIAERLGGLPLALELAASLLRVLSAGQLVARLEAKPTGTGRTGTLGAAQDAGCGRYAAVGSQPQSGLS